MKAKCEFCTDPLDADRTGTYQFMEGWVPRRAEGGPSTLRLTKRHMRYAHRHCIDKMAHGFVPGQGDLFA